MRFRFWLPTLQFVAMVLILWTPWNPDAHKFHVVLTKGIEIKTWTLVPGPNGLDWVTGINLPALVVIGPAESALSNVRRRGSLKVMFFGLWVVGLLCWYMIGKFVDDLLQWRKEHELPQRHFSDLIFAIVAAPSAILIALAFTMGGGGPPVIVGWGPVWVVATCAALVFRFRQFLRKRPVMTT